MRKGDFRRRDRQVDGFRVERISASRVIVAKGTFRFELRPQVDFDSHVVSRSNVDNGTRDERPGPSEPSHGTGGPTVFGPAPGGGPPGSPPPPPPPPPGGPRPGRR
jgi:hypothetical protein